MKIYRTRFPELGFIHNCDHWRFVDLSDDPKGDKLTVIGPQYHSKAELLGDLTRYATEYGLIP